MARAVPTRTKVGYTVAAWVVALLIFFPILYTLITSLKTEPEAIAGFNLIPSFTFESYAAVQSQSNYIKPFMNSVILAVGSTILGLIVGIPAAWAMAFSPTKRTKDVLMWMLSTKMMPAAAVLVPIYLMFIWLGLLDTHLGITIVLMLINLPIIIWMLYTYFREIPGEILEAARMDGAIALGRDLARAGADGGAGHRLDAAPQHHPGVERVVLDHPADHDQRRAADRLHRRLLVARRACSGPSSRRPR